MIKIDDTKFDWTEIEKIYTELAKKICIKVFENEDVKGSCLSGFLRNEFGASKSDFEKNIHKFLSKGKQEDINVKIQHSLECINNKFAVEEYTILLMYFFNTASTFKFQNVIPNLEGIFKDYKKFAAPINDLKVELKDLVNDNNEKFNNRVKKLCEEKIKKSDTFRTAYKIYDRNKEIEKIINYSYLSADNRHELLKAMNIDVCPYCNRQYITAWEDKDEKSHATADLDHFYPKSLYSIASLCLYNFIPSCQICNSRMKLAKDFYLERHLYPYEEEFGDDAKFQIKDMGSALLEGIAEVEIKKKHTILKEKEAAINKSLSTFKIEEVYQSHNQYVSELVEKVQIYNESQLSEYLVNFGEMFSSKEEIIAFVFGENLSKENYGKKPLSKLTHDILEELGIVL